MYLNIIKNFKKIKPIFHEKLGLKWNKFKIQNLIFSF